MATRQIKAHFHDGVFVPGDAIELAYGLTDEEIAAVEARVSGPTR